MNVRQAVRGQNSRQVTVTFVRQTIHESISFHISKKLRRKYRDGNNVKNVAVETEVSSETFKYITRILC